MNGYQIVSEAVGKTFYHSSPHQNLKVINPKDETKRLDQRGKKVFFSPDKGFTSAFSFKWGDNEGFNYGKSGNGPWTLKIPRKFKNRALKPCSIYVIKVKNYTSLKGEGGMTDEYVTTEIVKVLKEEKYKTALEAMKANGVKVIFI